ncbi:unnamed protein product [Microthlaspi erraticum]|uniref:F-box domain-containing protein n=1 Tax=Microthlaspi erraticum TaxID=1685480 RepID=A0A6D2KG40_9BRAS|nr:unnamed protein product [Microthlaspi erraticum]
MTRRRKSKIPDLPHELEEEILSKVPANSLQNLKTTCKRWYSLFRDPRFVEKNLGSEAAREREIILLMNFTVCSIRIDTGVIHDGLKPTLIFSGTLKNLKISEIFQCDGLILCTPKGNGRRGRLLIWNPCNGERKWIKPREVNAISASYALGFGYGNGSYKILTLRSYETSAEDIRSEFEIYDLSSDSWKVIDGSACGIDLLSPGVSLRENAYWIAFDGEIGIHMLNFDFERERFGRVPLPFQSEDCCDTFLLSVVRDGRLSLLYQSRYSSEATIWVTDEGKEMSWSVSLEVDLCEFMREDGVMMNLESFLLDEENGVAVCCVTEIEGNGGIARIFIVGEDLHVEAFDDERRKGRSFHHSPLLLSYVPSLVRLEKDKTKRQKKENNKGG